MPLLSRHHTRYPQCPCLGWYYKLCWCVRGEMNYYTRSYENKNKQINSPKLVGNIFINYIYTSISRWSAPRRPPPLPPCQPIFWSVTQHWVMGGWGGCVSFERMGGVFGGIGPAGWRGYELFQVVGSISECGTFDQFFGLIFAPVFHLCGHTHTQIDRQTDKIG